MKKFNIDHRLSEKIGQAAFERTKMADGDALLVIFKDHGLGEGELHHELHLAQDNPLFGDGVQNVYYPESLHIWLGTKWAIPRE